MGFPTKQQVGVAENDREIWVIAGITLLSPLTPIKTRTLGKGCREEEDSSEMTPREGEARIPETLLCPPAPKKPKPSLRCNLEEVQFFSPPDLESVFIRRAERVK